MQYFQTEKIQTSLEMLKDLTAAGLEYMLRMVKKYKIPIIFVNYMGIRAEIVRMLHQYGFPAYRLEHEAVSSMKYLMQYGMHLEKLKKMNSED